MSDSIWSGFYKLPISERQKLLARECHLSPEDLALLNKSGPLPLAVADTMSESVVGTIGLPLSVAPNFILNGRPYAVPMAIEEPSVVAAASHAAKLAAPEGFFTDYSGSIMIGQIQLVGVQDLKKAVRTLETRKEQFIAQANTHAGHITKYGGGVVGMDHRALETPRGPMLIVHFHVNVQDAMGANIVNTILEGVAPHMAESLGARVRLRILSNLSTLRMASARAVWKSGNVGGPDGIEGILDAYALAVADPYRRATHDKGIMNGIDAVALACGQDWRAIEAGAHSYSAFKNAPLTEFSKTKSGDLEGKISLPLAVGILGGSLKANPTANLSLRILGVKTSGELAQVMAAVGLAQNFAALRALSLEGIQKGHMRLHARHLASAAGAKPDEAEKVVELMLERKQVNEAGAADALNALRSKK
ncbi:MAG: hydroxymethylglutaryl-CoA reductase, degradative [Candidatus Micrarchaeota archaeon]